MGTLPGSLFTPLPFHPRQAWQSGLAWLCGVTPYPASRRAGLPSPLSVLVSSPLQDQLVFSSSPGWCLLLSSGETRRCSSVVTPAFSCSCHLCACHCVCVQPVPEPCAPVGREGGPATHVWFTGRQSVFLEKPCLTAAPPSTAPALGRGGPAAWCARPAAASWEPPS